MSHLLFRQLSVRCSSLISVALVAVSLAGATSANASITQVTINATVTPNTSYTMTISEGGNAYTWEIGIVTTGQFGSYSFFTPTSVHTGVAATVLQPLKAKRFVFQEGIGQADFFSTYPTGTGSSTENMLLHNYGNGTGNFSSFGVNQYAGFSFGTGLNTFFGWASFTMSGPNSVTLNDIAYTQGTIGAGMLIPAPGAVALLGLAGAAGTRRRR
ncbi:MAG: hypothetical protein FJ260_05725 [Planctomycetes bacterium]|nr:hypothetical protein [Planctomycetota bacterium]